MAILVLAGLPYLVIRQAFEWYMGYHPPGVVEAFLGCIEMLLVALATTALAGPAKSLSKDADINQQVLILAFGD